MALDALRGLTVAGMILVNNAGDWGRVYGQLEHAPWHGCTATDLIFPFFLFIVGVSITLSARRRGLDQAAAPSWAAARPILRRALLLFGLGLLLNAVPFTLERPLRVMGVLQRISLCYLGAALLAAWTRPRTQALAGAGLLLGTWAALRLVPVPGFGAFDLEKGHDLGAWLDRALLAGHLHQAAPDFAWFDPEGLFSTLPALATTLAGVLAGRWLADLARPPHERVSGLFAVGLAGAVLGLGAHAWLPLNKSLWTPSYALFTAGLACQALAVCVWLIDLQGLRRWAAPFLPFGKNPIVAFWASHALARVLVFGVTWQVPAAAGETRALSLKDWLYEACFARGGSTPLTSLAYAVVYLGVWWALMAELDRRRIYVKV